MNLTPESKPVIIHNVSPPFKTFGSSDEESGQAIGSPDFPTAARAEEKCANLEDVSWRFVYWLLFGKDECAGWRFQFYLQII